jgi:hypothetical protein
MNKIKQDRRSSRNLNGLKVERVHSDPRPDMGLKGADTIFVPLPRSLWRSCGKCGCPECQGREGFWDTLVIDGNGPKSGPDTTWTCHRPENHPFHDRTLDGIGMLPAMRYWTDPKTVPEAIPLES